MSKLSKKDEKLFQDVMKYMSTGKVMQVKVRLKEEIISAEGEVRKKGAIVTACLLHKDGTIHVEDENDPEFRTFVTPDEIEVVEDEKKPKK